MYFGSIKSSGIPSTFKITQTFSGIEKISRISIEAFKANGPANYDAHTHTHWWQVTKHTHKKQRSNRIEKICSQNTHIASHRFNLNRLLPLSSANEKKKTSSPKNNADTLHNCLVVARTHRGTQLGARTYKHYMGLPLQLIKLQLGAVCVCEVGKQFSTFSPRSLFVRLAVRGIIQYCVIAQSQIIRRPCRAWRVWKRMRTQHARNNHCRVGGWMMMGGWMVVCPRRNRTRGFGCFLVGCALLLFVLIRLGGNCADPVCWSKRADVTARNIIIRGGKRAKRRLCSLLVRRSKAQCRSPVSQRPLLLWVCLG